MLTGIFNNGEMVSNPKAAPAGSVEVHQTRDGQFALRYLGETISTFDSQSDANQVAAITSKVLPTTETYGQRYSRTTDWEARHIAKDLLEMNGRDARVSTHDEKRIAAMEAR